MITPVRAFSCAAHADAVLTVWMLLELGWAALWLTVLGLLVELMLKMLLLIPFASQDGFLRALRRVDDWVMGQDESEARPSPSQPDARGIV